MTSNKNCLVGRFAEEHLSDLRVFSEKVSDNQGNLVLRAYLLGLINYYGVKLLDVTVPSAITVEGSFQTLSREHLSGLDLALGYTYDQDGDGRTGEAEDTDEDTTTSDDEKRDLVFFSR